MKKAGFFCNGFLTSGIKYPFEAFMFMCIRIFHIDSTIKSGYIV